MLTTLRQQLHRLLRQRRGQLLLTLLAALWLALPLAATTSAHTASDTATTQPLESHCAQQAQTGADTHAAAHSGHHDSDHDCHCLQACHASPIALVATGLNLPPPTRAVQPAAWPQPLVSAVAKPLYRPPITLAA